MTQLKRINTRKSPVAATERASPAERILLPVVSRPHMEKDDFDFKKNDRIARHAADVENTWDNRRGGRSPDFVRKYIAADGIKFTLLIFL